tara:strand:- start:7711 stop:8919 length:1209 start_codon:yes stop_codon:yes gene_type:complete
MKSNFYFKNYISKKNLPKKKISDKKFKKLKKKILSEIDDPNKTLNIFNKNFNYNFNFKDLQKFKKFKKIAIIGMGGSILGTEAIYNLFKDKIKKEIFFFDNIDQKKNLDFKKKQKLKNVLFIIISKSGTTIETLSNFFYFNIIKKNARNIIIITEKTNNALYVITKKLNLFYIEHKKNIGGRYSVLSEVGIVPAFLMGLDVKRLRSNILKFAADQHSHFLKDSVILLSNLLNSKKIKNIVFINYAPEFDCFLYWCQQLIAESLGKKNKGFLPVISSAPKDHHSLLQLYLDGPKDKLFHVFSTNIKTNKKNSKNKHLPYFDSLYKKDLMTIKIAQKDALIKTLKYKNIPFREFKIETINEKSIGELFSYFIFETILVGKSSNINPYDQPAVERVKILTKKILN